MKNRECANVDEGSGDDDAAAKVLGEVEDGLGHAQAADPAGGDGEESPAQRRGQNDENGPVLLRQLKR